MVLWLYGLKGYVHPSVMKHRRIYMTHPVCVGLANMGVPRFMGINGTFQVPRWHSLKYDLDAATTSPPITRRFSHDSPAWWTGMKRAHGDHLMYVRYLLLQGRRELRNEDRTVVSLTKGRFWVGPDIVSYLKSRGSMDDRRSPSAESWGRNSMSFRVLES